MEHLNVTNIIITSQIYHTLKKRKGKKLLWGILCKQPEWNLQMFFLCSLEQCVPVRCWSQTHTHTHTRSFMMQLDLKLNLITPVSWESADVPKSLKFTSNKNPRMQATCCCSNKTTASHYRSHRYFFEALLTSQPNISIDRDKASPTSL